MFVYKPSIPRYKSYVYDIYDVPKEDLVCIYQKKLMYQKKISKYKFSGCFTKKIV